MNTRRLPSKQEEILRFIKEGYSREQIGKILNYSIETIKKQIASIREELGDFPATRPEGVSPQRSLVILAERYFAERGELEVIDGSSVSAEIVDLAEEALTNFYLIRIKGDPKEASKKAYFQLQRFEKWKANHQFSKIRNQLQHIEVRTIFEYQTSLKEMVTQADIAVWHSINTVTNQLSALAQETKQKYVKGLFEHCLGDEHYIRRDYAKAIHHLELATELLNGEDHFQDYLLWGLRELALARAYTNQKTDFLAVINKAYDVLAAQKYSHPEYELQILDADARGQGILGLEKVDLKIQEAVKSYYKAVKVSGVLPLRYIQLMTSVLEIKNIATEAEKRDLEIWSNNIFQYARDNGFPRHAEKIKKEMQRLGLMIVDDLPIFRIPTIQTV